MDVEKVGTEGALIPKVNGRIDIAIFRAGDSAGEGVHVNPIGADLEIVSTPGLLPCHSPIGCYSANVERGACAYNWRRRSGVLGSIDRDIGVEVAIPHAVAANARDVLAERTLDY